MKKFRSIAALAAASALLLAACSNDDNETSTDTGSTADADAQSYSIGLTQIVSHPALDSTASGIKRAFEEAGIEVEWDEQNAQGDQSVAVTIANTFSQADHDLVIGIATPSAQALVQAITDIPVVFSAVTDPVDAQLVESLEAPGSNVTGTTDANPVAEQLELITQIAPDARRVGIVYSSSEANSAVQVEWAKEAAEDLGLEIVEATVTASSEVQQAAQSLDVDAFYTPTDNTVISALEALLQVAETEGVPVISADADSVERGTVASYGIDYELLGYQTGQIAIRILTEGADPATTPVESQSELSLYLNPVAAERMSVTIPETLLADADPANVYE